MSDVCRCAGDCWFKDGTARSFSRRPCGDAVDCRCGSFTPSTPCPCSHYSNLAGTPAQDALLVAADCVLAAGRSSVPCAACCAACCSRGSPDVVSRTSHQCMCMRARLHPLKGLEYRLVFPYHAPWPQVHHACAGSTPVHPQVADVGHSTPGSAYRRTCPSRRLCRTSDSCDSVALMQYWAAASPVRSSCLAIRAPLQAAGSVRE